MNELEQHLQKALDALSAQYDKDMTQHAEQTEQLAAQVKTLNTQYTQDMKQHAEQAKMLSMQVNKLGLRMTSFAQQQERLIGQQSEILRQYNKIAAVLSEI